MAYPCVMLTRYSRDVKHQLIAIQPYALDPALNVDRKPAKGPWIAIGQLCSAAEMRAGSIGNGRFSASCRRMHVNIFWSCQRVSISIEVYIHPLRYLFITVIWSNVDVFNNLSICAFHHETALAVRLLNAVTIAIHGNLQLILHFASTASWYPPDPCDPSHPSIQHRWECHQVHPWSHDQPHPGDHRER